MKTPPKELTEKIKEAVRIALKECRPEEIFNFPCGDKEIDLRVSWLQEGSKATISDYDTKTTAYLKGLENVDNLPKE